MFSQPKIKKVIVAHWQTSVLVLITVVLALIPSLVWKSYGYFVGGDDSLLHYSYPQQMINNFSLNIAVNNNLSGPKEYVERLDMLPLLYLISVVNTVTGVTNSLYLFLGMILAGSFLSLFFLLSEISEKKNKGVFVEKTLISIFYTFSVHHYLSVMNYKLLVMYILFVVPLTLAFFSKAVLKKKPLFLIPAALICSLFSVVLIGVPWLLGFLISSVGLLIYLCVKQPWRFVNYSLRLFLLITAMNFYWIFHFIFAIVSATSQTSVYTNVLAEDFRKKNIEAILSVTNGNELLPPILGFFHPSLQKDFNWPTFKIYENWHSHFTLLNALVIAVIFFVLLLLRGKKTNLLLPMAILGWLGAIYFFTVNILGAYGTRIFLLLNKIVPGFSMFRNSYDKFASGLAFAFSLVLFATALQIKQNSKISSSLKKSWVILLALFTFTNTMPVIYGIYERDIFITTEQSRASVEELDKDFLKFAEELKSVRNATVLWLPLSNASYIVVPDNNNSNYIYAGISPLTFLSNVHDYAGILSFRSKESQLFSQAIEAQDSKSFGNLLKEMGINYIAINNSIPKEMEASYLYGTNFLQKQSEVFANEFLGDQVISIAGKYELYKVKDPYYQELFYFPSSCKVESYDLTSRETYRVQFSVSSEVEKCQLIFNHTFSQLWKMKQKGTGSYSSTSYNFQNSWIIDSEQKEVTIYFEPRKWMVPLYVFSGLTILVSTIYLIIRIAKREQ